MNGIRCFLSVTRGRAAPPRRRGFARDVIVSVDGIPMQTVDSNGVHDLPWSHARGERVPLVVDRGGERVSLSITVE